MPKTKDKAPDLWIGSFTPYDPKTAPAVVIPAEPAPPPPAAVSSVPSTYPAGPTYESFLYSLLTSEVDATTGVTRAYISNTPNTASGLRGWHIDKLDKAQTTSSGLSFDVEGACRWEIGVDFDTATDGTADFITAYDPSCLANEVQQVSVGTNSAGQFKLTFNAQQTANIAVNASAATVKSAIAALSTVGGASNVDVAGRNGGPWLVEFKGTLAAANQTVMTMADGDTPLSGGSGQAVTTIQDGTTGADLMRWSPYSDASGVIAPKLGIGAPIGTPRADTEFVLINAPSGLSGLSVRYRDDAGTLNGLNFTNISTANKRAIINFNNYWQVGMDYQHADTENFHIVDTNASGTPIRFYLEGAPANTLVPKAGVNTANPLSMWHIANSNDSSLYDTPQTLLSAGYSTLTNRTMQWQQILNASQANNFFWMMGTLGAGSTEGTPVADSIGPVCHGIACDQSVMSLISAPSGTNQTINRVVRVGNNQLSFFDATPVSKQSVAAAATDAGTTQTLANSLRTIMINLGLAS